MRLAYIFLIPLNYGRVGGESCVRSSSRPLSQNSFPLTQNIHLFQQRIRWRRIINAVLILERFKHVFTFSMRVPINPEQSKTSGVPISNKLAH